METAIRQLAIRIIAVNDAVLDGEITREEQAAALAQIQTEMDAAGITWANVERVAR